MLYSDIEKVKSLSQYNNYVFFIHNSRQDVPYSMRITGGFSDNGDGEDQQPPGSSSDEPENGHGGVRVERTQCHRWGANQ